MNWKDYYEKFYDWSESTQLNRISSIVDFTSTDEIVEIAENFDEKGAERLIDKALSQSVYFGTAQIIKVCKYLNKETTIKLIKQCNEKFTAQQIEQITEDTFLEEDEIVTLQNPEGAIVAIKKQNNMPKTKKLGFFATIGLGFVTSYVFDKLLGNNNEH